MADKDTSGASNFLKLCLAAALLAFALVAFGILFSRRFGTYVGTNIHAFHITVRNSSRKATTETRTVASGAAAGIAPDRRIYTKLADRDGDEVEDYSHESE